MELVFGWVVTEAELRQSDLLLRAASSVAIFAGSVFVTLVACLLYGYWQDRRQARKRLIEERRVMASIGYRMDRCKTFHRVGGSFVCETPDMPDVIEIYVPKPINISNGD